MTSSPDCWFNGHWCARDAISLSAQDPALIYGATVFTTLRVYEQDLHHPLTAWRDHCDRCRRSLQAFHWPQPDWSRLTQAATTLIQAGYPVLRLTLFPDGRELLLGRSLPSDLETRQRQGVTVWVADSPDFSRLLPQHKTGNYLGCWLALQAACRHNAQEAVLINDQDHWLETSTGNLWGWADGSWWTPPLAVGILPGILRSRLIAGLQAQGIPVQVAPWTRSRRSQFTTLAYTNSVYEIVPIRQCLQIPDAVNYNPDYDLLQTLWQAKQFVPD